MVDSICTGIDLIEIDRIRKSIDNNARFLIRFFGEEERMLFTGSNSVERIAANFAAKEAFSKAIGTGISNFALKEVQTLRNNLGAPYLYLTGKAAIIAKEKGLEFTISLSHTKNYATAIVIGYTSIDKE